MPCDALEIRARGESEAPLDLFSALSLVNVFGAECSVSKTRSSADLLASSLIALTIFFFCFAFNKSASRTHLVADVQRKDDGQHAGGGVAAVVLGPAVRHVLEERRVHHQNLGAHERRGVTAATGLNRLLLRRLKERSSEKEPRVPCSSF